MALIPLDVKIYDPAIPFELVSVANASLDTWHDYTLITQQARNRLPYVKEKSRAPAPIPGGMSISVPLIEIGVQIDTIKIDNVDALVVGHSNYHELLFGSRVLEQIFAIGSEGANKIRIASERKEDPTALAIELFPVNTAVDLKSVEYIFRYQRHLHNIILISLQEIQTPPIDRLNQVIYNDYGIPDHLRLKLTWIDFGSIWTTLKSGSHKALTYLASLFEASTSAKVAQQMADAKKAEVEATISQDTRDAAADSIRLEEEKLGAESLSRTYELWRGEARERLKFLDELIDQVTDPQVKEELKKQKDRAILRLAQQQILPIVRNVPHAREETPDDHSLPKNKLR